jgi:hypothetical protein
MQRPPVGHAPSDPEADTALLIYAGSDPKDMGRPALLLVAALLPLLAGCSGPAAKPAGPSPLEAAAAGLQAGQYYAFDHGGGDLVFAVPANGSAEAVLYGAGDTRIGHIGLGAGQASGRFVIDGLQPGTLVLGVLSVNGTLDVRSSGRPVTTFRPLPLHVERHVLVDRPSQTPALPILLDDPLDESMNVSLLRAPTALRIVAHDASFQDLEVRVTGRDGVVHEVQLGTTPTPFPSYEEALPGDSYPENIRDGELTVEMRSTSFKGALILEADSYSRALVDEGGAHPSRDVPRFTYGALPDQPVSFEVRSGAKQVYLWVEARGSSQTPSPSSSSRPTQDPEPCARQTAQAEACQDKRPVVALFGPHDERLATVVVPANQTVAVPVRDAGTWVAVLLRGDATLGADAVPTDFELHPLDTVQATTPDGPAGGSDGSYGEERVPLHVEGVPFHVEALQESATGGMFGVPSFGFGACGGATLAVSRDGETIAAWGYQGLRQPTWDPDLYLGAGDLEAVHSDYGGACGRLSAVVAGYVR